VNIFKRDDLIENKFRFFLEECNSAQGVQVFADSNTGFGGFAAEMVEAIREEVGKLPIVVFGIVEEAGSGMVRYGVKKTTVPRHVTQRYAEPFYGRTPEVSRGKHQLP
jgi:hypothetical protein